MAIVLPFFKHSACLLPVGVVVYLIDPAILVSSHHSINIFIGVSFASAGFVNPSRILNSTTNVTIETMSVMTLIAVTRRGDMVNFTKLSRFRIRRINSYNFTCFL